MPSTLTLASRPCEAAKPDLADRQEAIRSLARAALQAVMMRRAEFGAGPDLGPRTGDRIRRIGD